MPDRPPIDDHNPSFFRFDLNNSRTGFQPVFLPVLLIEPDRRTPSGDPIASSQVFDTKFFISDAPRPARVAGPFNTGILIPQSDLFTIEVSRTDLATRQIDLDGQVFFDQETGEQKTFEEARNGDSFAYALLKNGVISREIPYLVGANYYDLSTFEIGVEDLPRPERYLFVWQTSYNPRIVSTVGEFLCINEDDVAIGQYTQEVAHPGEVHQEMFKRTPPLYFDVDVGGRLEDSRVLAFYRPFADILQDLWDESEFLNGINQVDKIPAQLIPYLAYLIGWDLPNFPGVSDNIRRSILKQAVALQQLKGSRRAIIELFSIFGFSIELLNLWFSKDGTRLIAPGEALPEEYEDQEIEVENSCQVDVLVADFNDSGFGEFQIPLLYKPEETITLDAWLVTDDSPTRVALDKAADDITNNPEAFATEFCGTTPDGFLIPQKLLDTLPTGDAGVISMSQVLVNVETGKGVSDIQVGSEPIINQIGVEFGINLDAEKNLLSITFDSSLNLQGRRVFIFATYNRNKIIVPETLSNLRSNRFDVRILLDTLGDECLGTELLEILLNFLFELKAFHSILRKIAFTCVQTEVYNVQDFCLGGEIQQDPNFDAGKLQVPPAILPPEISEGVCSETLVSGGYKPEDLALRDRVIEGLKEEHETWKALDGTHPPPDPLLEALQNILSPRPEGEECQWTQLGQDRVVFDGDTDFDHEPDTRAKVCDDEPPLPDNCFKGRVEAEIDPQRVLSLTQRVRCKPCRLGFGAGFYWLLPIAAPQDALNGTGQDRSRHLGKLLRQYNAPSPETLHFTNRPFFLPEMFENDQYLAIERPDLDIDKPTLNFPSHRFVSMANLLDDFVSPDYRMKPWDVTPTCEDPDPDPLNWRLVVDSEGIEHIVFDDADLIYPGNGINPDVSGFDIHDDREYLVTHKIYLWHDEGHPAVELDDSVVPLTTGSIDFDSAQAFPPIFKSFNANCNMDWQDGYPAVFDRQPVDPTVFIYDKTPCTGTEPDPLSEALGLPTRSCSDIPDNALFFFGSQILIDEDDSNYRYFMPYRFDCECNIYPCDTTAEEQLNSLLNVDTCFIDNFIDEQGFYDYNCDRVTIDPTVILAETFGTCSTRMDGEIPNFACQLIELTSGQEVIPPDQDLGESGSFLFKDDYDVIYEVTWFRSGNRLDITTVSKAPVVWGEEPSGFVTSDRKVFRRGTITTTRQILERQEGGSYIVVGQGSEQVVDLYQSNFTCGQERPEDNFCYHLDCGVSDEIDGLVTCGTRWTDPDDPDDDIVVWGDLVEDSAGDVIAVIVDPGFQRFQWVDVWGDDDPDLTAVCEGLTAATV